MNPFQIQQVWSPMDLPGESYSDGPITIAWPEAQLHIGKFCAIARNLRVFLGGNHHMHWTAQFPLSWRWKLPAPPAGKTTNGDVVIGNDVWIGDSVTIMSGSTIGHGAAIGACSVVAGEVPPYAIAAGNPCRVRKYRFQYQTIERLLALAWWDWPEEKIRRAAPLLQSEDIEALIVFGAK